VGLRGLDIGSGRPQKTFLKQISRCVGAVIIAKTGRRNRLVSSEVRNGECLFRSRLENARSIESSPSGLRSRAPSEINLAHFLFHR